MRETRWQRASIGGAPHPHSFTLDGERPSHSVELVATRNGHGGHVRHRGLHVHEVHRSRGGWTTCSTTTPPCRPPPTASPRPRWMRAGPGARCAARLHGGQRGHPVDNAGSVRHHLQPKACRIACIRMGERGAREQVPEVATVSAWHAPTSTTYPMNLDRLRHGRSDNAGVHRDRRAAWLQIECDRRPLGCDAADGSARRSRPC